MLDISFTHDELSAAAEAISQGELDQERIIDLFLGVDPQGRSFYCYLAIRPSKYLEYKSRVIGADYIPFSEFGDIIWGEWAALPPPYVQEAVTTAFGFIHDLEERIAS